MLAKLFCFFFRYGLLFWQGKNSQQTCYWAVELQVALWWTLQSSFLWNQLLWRSGSWDKSELAAHTYHNFLCQENQKSSVMLAKPCHDRVLNKIEWTPSDVCPFYSFLWLWFDNINWSCSVSSRTLIFVAYQKWQDSYVLSLCLLWMNYLLINPMPWHCKQDLFLVLFFRLKHPNVKSLMLIELISIRMPRSGLASPVWCCSGNTLLFSLAIHWPGRPGNKLTGQAICYCLFSGFFLSW